MTYRSLFPQQMKQLFHPHLFSQSCSSQASYAAVKQVVQQSSKSGRVKQANRIQADVKEPMVIEDSKRAS